LIAYLIISCKVPFWFCCCSCYCAQSHLWWVCIV